MTDDNYLAFAAALQAEHQELGHVVQRLRRSLNEEHPWSAGAAAEALETLALLQAQLKRHFLAEEAGGYLEQALAVAPRFSGAAAKLLAEHPRLLGQISRVITTGQQTVADGSHWASFKNQVNDLIANLGAHETAENHIVQEAMNSGLEID